MDRNFRKPLELLIKTNKIDSAYADKIMKIVETEWVWSMVISISAADTDMDWR